MNKPRSFATFRDGHLEDIVWFREYGDNGMVFATESGIYLDRNRSIDVTDRRFLHPNLYSRLDFKDPPNEIGYPIIEFPFDHSLISYTIDKRVPYHYFISGKDGVCIEGTVYADPNANEIRLRALILEDINIEYEQKE